jgi:hypothetical protein
MIVVLAAGCTTADRGGPATPQPTAATAPVGPSTPVAGPATTPPGPGTSAPAATDHRVTYGWAVPSREVRISHDVRPPVVPPPGPPLPLLVDVRVGDHPEEGHTRITFAFRGGPPSYTLAYVPRVLADGTGDPVPLPGNAFLRIQFDPAQAHDEHGRSSLTSTAEPRLGYPTLRGYALAGDFEGHVTHGLGLQVAPGSDQAPPIRALELTRPDGTRVVAVDVRRS